MFCLWEKKSYQIMLEGNDARKSTSYSNILFLSDKSKDYCHQNITFLLLLSL